MFIFDFFRLVYALSVTVAVLSIVIIVLALCVCMKRKGKGKNRKLKRKLSDEELNRPPPPHHDPNTEDLDFQRQWEETEDRVLFIRSRRIVDGVKTGFAEHVDNIGFQDSNEQSRSSAVLNME